MLKELIAKIIIDKPDDIREFLCKELQKYQNNADKLGFFDKEDFDMMFENCNILRTGEIPVSNLVQCNFSYLKIFVYFFNFLAYKIII